MMILHEERGSLPMALLVIIVMAGLLTVLTASVVAGQRQTRFDESFEESLPMAESGLERAKAVILEGKKSTNFCIEPTSAAPGGELKTTCANPPAKNKWVVSADQTSSGWLLTAIGDVNDTVRTVKQEVKIDSPFQVAAFGKFFADFNGGNGADSYRSGNWDLSSGTPSFTWTDATAVTGLLCSGSPGGAAITDPTAASQSDAFICTPRATGEGIVATNGSLKLKGQVANETDRIEIHYAQAPKVPDPLPGATGKCAGVPQTCDMETSSPQKLFYFRDPIEMAEPVAPCSTSAGSFPGSRVPDLDGNYRLGPGSHCFTNVTLDADGPGGAPDVIIEGTAENPTRIFLTGTLHVENAALINFKRRIDGTYDPIPRPPASLLIYSTGTGPTLTFGNHASVSAAVYAPSAAFGGGAQGNIYGAMIAGSINNNGGWNFHYDESLRDFVVGAPLVGENWRED